MNTAQHTTKVRTVHEIRMSGPITARDIGDFIHQVNNVFEKVKGRKVKFDDDYYVTGDEEGLTATFEIERES